MGVCGSGTRTIGELQQLTVRAWPPNYPRPMVRRDGSILLLNEREFCSQPPEPFPDWLTTFGITPPVWRTLVWAYDCELLNTISEDHGPGMYGPGTDETQILPRVSVKMAAYVARIAPKWAARGLRIEYIEGTIMGVWLSRGVHVSCEMNNHLLFSPTSSPAPERPSTEELKQCRSISTGQAIWFRDLQFNRGVRVPGPVPPSATVTTVTPGLPAAQKQNLISNSDAADKSSHATQGHEIAQPAPSAVSTPAAGPSSNSPRGLLLVAPARVSTTNPPATTEAEVVDAVAAVPVLAHAEGVPISAHAVAASPANANAAAAAAADEWKTSAVAPKSCSSCSAWLQVLEGYSQPRFCPQCGVPVALAQ